MDDATFGPNGDRRAIFLDRDGVLNDAVVRDGMPHPPFSLEELAVAHGAAEACTALRCAGFLLIVVSNQPDIARGTATREQVDAINDALRGALQLDDVLVCPHDDADGCVCRKPQPGLLIEGARRWGVDLSSSFMIGDRWRDIEAGRRAGCTTVFVDLGHAERRPERPDITVSRLTDAVPLILENPTVEGVR